MAARRRAVLLVAALAVAGCGDDDRRVPVACVDARDAMQAALRAAPRPVRLPDGTRISACVDGARTDAELQNLGADLTSVAERLEERAPRDEAAAVQLGYLVGAARRGAAKTLGLQVELVRRLERSAALSGAPDTAVDAVQRGMQAGQATG